MRWMDRAKVHVLSWKYGMLTGDWRQTAQWEESVLYLSTPTGARLPVRWTERSAHMGGTTAWLAAAFGAAAPVLSWWLLELPDEILPGVGAMVVVGSAAASFFAFRADAIGLGLRQAERQSLRCATRLRGAWRWARAGAAAGALTGAAGLAALAVWYSPDWISDLHRMRFGQLIAAGVFGVAATIGSAAIGSAWGTAFGTCLRVWRGLTCGMVGSDSRACRLGPGEV